MTTHHKAIDCRWRRLSVRRQALPVLAHLRNGDIYAQGAGGTVTTPIKGKNLTIGQRHVNLLINRRRGPGERAFATLKTWKTFTRVRCCPHRIGPMALAILALEQEPE